MQSSSASALYRRYLGLLGLEREAPSIEALRRVVRAHLEHVPFENISKLYYLTTRGKRDIPDLELFLEGIELRRFGGTCYSCNPYLRELLEYLGYEARLCGADMSDPDVHTALLVHLDGREYHVDVGYAAPLFEPVPRDLDREFEARLGNERWVLQPRDESGRSRMDHYRDEERIHGYVAKSAPRDLKYFREIIADSYRHDSTFMNHLRIVRFAGDTSLGLSDTTLVRAEGERVVATRLAGRAALLQTIEECFGIAPSVAREALAVLNLPT